MQKQKFNLQRVVCKQQYWHWIFPQNFTFFSECNSDRIGQNIQNEVSLERSIFADVDAYQFININWNLNGSVYIVPYGDVYDPSRPKRLRKWLFL